MEKLPEKAKTQLVQEQKTASSEPAKSGEDATILSAVTSATSEVDPLATDEPKVDKKLETKVDDGVDKSSDSPLETDPLATDKDETPTNSSKEKTSDHENEENQPSSTPVKNQQEGGTSGQEKNTSGTVQETESTTQSVTSKLEPVSLLQFLIYFLLNIITDYTGNF